MTDCEIKHNSFNHLLEKDYYNFLIAFIPHNF